MEAVLSKVEIQVVVASEIGEGEMRSIDVGSRQILIARSNDQLFAIDAICNHGLAYLEEGAIEGFDIVCPLHGGSFDLRTGAPTKPPAVAPLRIYPVRVDEGRVFVTVGD